MKNRWVFYVVALILSVLAKAGYSSDVKLLLPLGRTAYQTNESVDVAVVRTGEKLDAGKLELTLTSADGSKVACSFDVKPATTRVTEHLCLNARLLRPDTYTLSVNCDGATATTPIEIHSHLRRSTFKLIDWGSRAKGEEQALLGENSLGFNLNYAAYGGIDADSMIKGHIDYMRNCTMSGAHQMDIRQECDWSDPYVLQGGEARVVREALIARRNPNALGVHFYDEPGLTWLKDPKTGIMTPYNLPATDRSYRSTIGAEPINYKDVKPDDAAAVEKWNAMNRWKLSVMDAAWKYSQSGVSQVDPKLLSVTQSAYGFSAYADGYYFNVARSLPVLSTHGGYDDFGAGYWNPALTFEMGRMRDYSKPNWYLATWNGKMPPNQYRMETWLCFMMNMQGIAKPPDAQIHKPESMGDAAEGIIEVNRIAERLGTIFTTMPVDRGDVAMLYSLSTILNGQVRDMQNATDLNKSAYEGGGHSRDKILLAYEAGKQIHQNLFPIVEEDILDGTAAANFKAIFLPGVNALEPSVIAALKAYISGGGLVIVSDDSKVNISGATKLGYAMTCESMEKARQLYREKKEKEFQALETTNYYWKAAEPTARALAARLKEKHLSPPVECSNTEVVTSRQAFGDVEYIFAVNTTFDENEAKRNSIKGARARLSFTVDGRQFYDAIHGGHVVAPVFLGSMQPVMFEYTFGPGQMRVLARTARPIGAVQVRTPTVRRDFTSGEYPITLQLAASVVDDKSQVLAGSIPLQIRVTDALGVTRFEGYRATDRGDWRMELPLAANDPAGDWKITVTELLANNTTTTTFKYQPLATCGAIAGAQPDAISFGPDRENIFRFFRTHRDVSLITGSSDYNTAAAQRIAEILKPWDVKCTIISAKEAAQPREVEASAQPTWVGLEPGRIGPSKDNPKGTLHPNQVGFSVRGPTIILGTPEDNPILKFAVEKNFLPYTPNKTDYPGPNRGMIAWQRDLVSYQSESITLIAYDEAGMNQAVGTLYQSASAIDPLMPLTNATVTITAANKSTATKEETIAWRTTLPDRPVTMSVTNNHIVITTTDGTATTIDENGKILSQKSTEVPTATAFTSVKTPKEFASNLLQHHIVKTILASNDKVAIAYWGGAIQIFDPQGNLKTQQQLPHDPIALVWNDKQLVIAQSDGSVIGLGSR